MIIDQELKETSIFARKNERAIKISSDENDYTRDAQKHLKRNGKVNLNRAWEIGQPEASGNPRCVLLCFELRKVLPDTKVPGKKLRAPGAIYG